MCPMRSTLKWESVFVLLLHLNSACSLSDSCFFFIVHCFYSDDKNIIFFVVVFIVSTELTQKIPSSCTFNCKLSYDLKKQRPKSRYIMYANLREFWEYTKPLSFFIKRQFSFKQALIIDSTGINFEQLKV